jgi:hypothetical protein
MKKLETKSTVLLKHHLKALKMPTRRAAFVRYHRLGYPPRGRLQEWPAVCLRAGRATVSPRIGYRAVGSILGLRWPLL